MPRRPAHAIPEYRLHRTSGRAYVTIDGRRVYLGRHGTAESRRRYDDVIAEYVRARSRPKPPQPARLRSTEALSVTELVVAYDAHAIEGIGSAGRRINKRRALQVLIDCHAYKLASSIRGPELVEVRERLIRQPGRYGDRSTRATVTDRLAIIRACFAWGVERGLLGPEGGLLLMEQKAVRGPGKGEAEPSRRTRPVPGRDLVRTLRRLNPVVADMVRVQLRAAMRPSEVRQLRPANLTREGGLLVYRPEEHKLEHEDIERVVVLGPRVSRLIGRYLDDRPPRRPVFTVLEAQQVGSGAIEPGWPPRLDLPSRYGPDRGYAAGSYRQAIERACERAGVPVWHPCRLRHTRLTEVRRRFGLEAAQAAAQHTSITTTQLYAGVREDLARTVARAIG